MANKKHKDVNKPFKWKQVIGEVILWLVTWYSRYALAYRDLNEMAAKRGFAKLSIIYRWVHEYGAPRSAYLLTGESPV